MSLSVCLRQNIDGPHGGPLSVSGRMLFMAYCLLVLSGVKLSTFVCLRARLPFIRLGIEGEFLPSGLTLIILRSPWKNKTL